MMELAEEERLLMPAARRAVTLSAATAADSANNPANDREHSSADRSTSPTRRHERGIPDNAGNGRSDGDKEPVRTNTHLRVKQPTANEREQIHDQNGGTAPHRPQRDRRRAISTTSGTPPTCDGAAAAPVLSGSAAAVR